MTKHPGLDAIQERLHAAQRDRRASLLVTSSVGVEIQRMQEDVRDGYVAEAEVIYEAAVMLGAALSTSYRPRRHQPGARP